MCDDRADGLARHRVRRAPGDRARDRPRGRVVAGPDDRGDRRIAARGGRRTAPVGGRRPARATRTCPIDCGASAAVPRPPSSASSSGCATSPTLPTSSASGSSGSTTTSASRSPTPPPTCSCGASPARCSGGRPSRRSRDHRVEAIAQRAREAGWASGEVTLGEARMGPRWPERQQVPAGDARRPRAAIADPRRLARPRGRRRAPPPPAHPRRVHRQPLARAPDADHDDRAPGRIAGARRRGRRGGRAPVPPKMRERIGKLEVETGNIAQMVAELLDLARIESGGRQLHLDDVDLARIATESVERLRPFAERQGVDLRLDLDERSPAGARRGGAAGAGLREPRPQRDQVQLVRHGGANRGEAGRPDAGGLGRRRRARASRRATRRGSSSGSTRQTGRGRPAAAPASGWPSRATSWRATGA